MLLNLGELSEVGIPLKRDFVGDGGSDI